MTTKWVVTVMAASDERTYLKSWTQAKSGPVGEEEPLPAFVAEWTTDREEIHLFDSLREAQETVYMLRIGALHGIESYETDD